MPRRRSSSTTQARSAEAAPAARGVWSGSLSFGLVTVPIALYSAHKPRRTARTMLSADGSPLEREYFCPEDGHPLEAAEIVRGYEVADGEFVVIGDDELEGLAPRRSRDLEILQFVPRESLDPAYFVHAYFMLPDREEHKAYAVLASAMEASGRVAIGRFVMRERAHLVAIFADGGLLRAEILRFGDELRDASDAGLRALPRPQARRVAQMQRAIQGLARAELDEDELRDEESERMLELARKKLARGKDVFDLPVDDTNPADKPEPGKVIDLVALLKRRLSSADGRRRPKRKAASARRRKKTRA